MPDLLRIQPPKGRLGRTFEVSLFNFATANASWDVGTSDYCRPVFISYGGTEQAVRAFTANLRTGRRVFIVNEHGHEEDKLECMRSAGYRFIPQRIEGEMTAVTVYLPHLFEIDPGISPERVCFVFAPPSWWVDAQLAQLPFFHPEERREVAVACYFAAYLDRRTSLPVLNDPRFHLRLWRAAQGQSWVVKPQGSRWDQKRLYVYPKPLVGLELMRLVDSTHDAVEQFLYDQTRRFFAEERPDYIEERVLVETGIPGAGGLLPDPATAAGQLSLFGFV